MKFVSTAAPGRRLWFEQVGRVAGFPLQLMRSSRRRFRTFLAFSTIDNHTLDDIGLRRSIFTAAPSNDGAFGFVEAGCCPKVG